jgi:D-alanyl-lipoteichoic acid acyltransferase DltB (MBOAT superfamily)
LRLLIGAVKYRFLAGLLDQMTYTGLLLDGHPHHWADLGVAAVAYYLYLYCNFSGFCDMAIGAAGLIGVDVEENFRHPFAARNVRDFWNRWHITLSTYMRDVVFTPVSKYLTGVFGTARSNHAVALAIAAVFLLIGVWHGPGWHYVAFGAMHALGVVVNHYYTVWLKRRLGRDRFNAYNRNPMIQAAAVATTFIFVTASMFLFANTFADMRRILAAVQWS